MFYCTLVSTLQKVVMRKIILTYNLFMHSRSPQMIKTAAVSVVMLTQWQSDTDTNTTDSAALDTVLYPLCPSSFPLPNQDLLPIFVAKKQSDLGKCTHL